MPGLFDNDRVSWGYWLSLLSSDPLGTELPPAPLVEALESSQQLLIDLGIAQELSRADFVNLSVHAHMDHVPKQFQAVLANSVGITTTDHHATDVEIHGEKPKHEAGPR